MPNVQTRHLFSTDNDFVAAMREAFVNEEEKFRIEYLKLVKELEALAWIERLLREKVLRWDSRSIGDRLRGAQLAEHLNRRASR